MASYEFIADLQALIPTEIIDILSALNSFWRWLPFAYVFIGHCLFCSMSAKELRDRCFVHYVLTFLWGNGGGVVTTALLMAPQHAKFSFFASNEVLGIWTVCWWLVNYCPGGLVYEVLNKWYIKMFVKSCTSLLRALLIVQRVDLAVKLYPGVVAAPLILGTLAGCGGRLIADALLHNWQGLPGYAELSSPGFVSRSAAMAAASYYLLGYVLQLLPLPAAAGLVVSTLMVHSFATVILDQPLDFTAPVAALLHKLTLTPVPPPQPTPAPAVVFSRTCDAAAAPTSPAAMKSPAAKTKTPSNTPAKEGTPSRDRAAAAAATVAAEVVGNVAEGAHVAKPQSTRSRGSAASADVLKAVDANVTGEGSLAATRPRRSQRKSVAYAS